MGHSSLAEDEPVPIALVPRAPLVPASLRATMPAIRGPGALEPIRLANAELVDAITGDLHEIGLATHGVGAAQRCLSIAARYLPSRAGLVRHRDSTRRDDLVVAARGDASELLMGRHAAGEPMLARAHHVVVVSAALGAVRLATIELADPLDGAPFTAHDAAALRVLAAHYASLLASRTIVVNAAEVARFALEPLGGS